MRELLRTHPPLPLCDVRGHRVRYAVTVACRCTVGTRLESRHCRTVYDTYSTVLYSCSVGSRVGGCLISRSFGPLWACVRFSHSSLLLTGNFCPSHAQAQSRHSSLRRVLVLPGGMPLLHETSSTATHHPLPNGLPVINLHMTKPVCACAAQRPLNASASRPGGASTREAPGFPRSLPRSPGPSHQVRRLNIL